MNVGFPGRCRGSRRGCLCCTGFSRLKNKPPLGRCKGDRVQFPSTRGKAQPPPGELPRDFQALRARTSVTLSAATPFRPYGIAYRSAYGSFTAGLFEHPSGVHCMAGQFSDHTRTLQAPIQNQQAFTSGPLCGSFREMGTSLRQSARARGWVGGAL